MKFPKININNNNVYLYRDTEENLNKHAIEFKKYTPIAYSSNCTEIIDNRNNSYHNVELYGSNPITITKPVINYNIIYDTDKPKLSFTVSDYNNPVDLYYRAIIQDKDELSLSNIVKVTISQNKKDITSKLMFKNNGRWIEKQSVSLDDINVVEDIIGSTHIPLNKNDISFNNKYVVNTNTSIIKIPNIWFKDNKYQLLKSKEMKIVNTASDGTQIESDVLLLDLLVPIDKLRITRNDRKEINIIRKNGIYHDKSIKYNLENEHMVYEDMLIDFGLGFDYLNIYDTSVSNETRYMYDIVLYDSLGNEFTTRIENEVIV